MGDGLDGLKRVGLPASAHQRPSEVMRDPLKRDPQKADRRHRGHLGAEHRPPELRPVRGARVQHGAVSIRDLVRHALRHRPRTGGDSGITSITTTPSVSIRASARGATLTGGTATKRHCFNPRPRTGGDFSHTPRAGSSSSFNPRPRTGGDIPAVSRGALHL